MLCQAVATCYVALNALILTCGDGVGLHRFASVLGEFEGEVQHLEAKTGSCMQGQELIG